MNKNLIDFLLSLKNASLAKKDFVKIKESRLISKYLPILYKEGIIQSFFKKQDSCNSFYIVNLRHFQNKVITQDIQLISTPSKIKKISRKELISLHLKNKMLILSTPKGIMSHINSIRHKAGGFIIFSC